VRAIFLDWAKDNQSTSDDFEERHVLFCCGKVMAANSTVEGREDISDHTFCGVFESDVARVEDGADIFLAVNCADNMSTMPSIYLIGYAIKSPFWLNCENLVKKGDTFFVGQAPEKVSVYTAQPSMFTLAPLAYSAYLALNSLRFLSMDCTQEFMM